MYEVKLTCYVRRSHVTTAHRAH